MNLKSSGRNRAVSIVPSVMALIGALLVFSLFLLISGKNPFATISAICQGAFGSVLGIQETLSRATPLLLCALAVALPAKAGLFNIGGEGQLHIGAMAATFVVLHMDAAPTSLVIPAMIMAALIAGAIWALLPGILRALLGVNDVLVTLMSNYVAILLVEHLVHGPWRDPKALGWPYTARFPEAAILPTLGQSHVHMGLLIALVVAVLLFLALRFTTWGLAVRVIEANARTARYAHINVALFMILLMAAGGAMAAMAGLGEVSVIQGRLRPGISPGYGYTGFLIAWLSGHDFLKIMPVAILIGGLYSGADALQLTAGLPSSTTDIFMGIVFLAFLVSGYLRDRIVSRINQEIVL